MQDKVCVSPKILKPHPKNREYFDDVTGEDYKALKDSISHSGIIQPIVVSPDMTILGGHHRVKAAIELGFETVEVQILNDVISDEDKEMKLLETNFGRQKNSEPKQRKVIARWVELMGFKHGEAGLKTINLPKGQIDPLVKKLTLSQIADQLGIGEKDLKRTLAIERNLTDSMKDLLDTGVIGKTLAADCIASMTPEEQEELVKSLDATRKYTAKELQPYIDKIKKLETEVSNKEEKVEQRFSDTIKNLKGALSQAQEDANWYKGQYDDVKSKLDAVNAPKYQSHEEFSGIAANTTYFSHLLFKVQEMLDNDLSPVKFSQAIDGIQKRKVDRQNLTLLLKKVQDWCMDIEKIVQSEEVEVIEEITVI